MAGVITLPTLVQRIFIDSSQTGKARREIEGNIGGVSRTMQRTGSFLTKAVTVPMLGFAAAGVKAAADVDKGLREVNSLFGQTGKAAEQSFGQLRKLVGDLSADVGIAQDVLVKGLYQAISAGVPKDNAFSFMQVAAKASIAGVTDVETAIDGLTTTINAFGLEASDVQAVADSMFATVQGGKTNFAQLSDALFNVAPAAAALGVSFQEVNAAIATLTASGTPTSVATTQIRAALVGLTRPSKEMDEIFGSLGFKSAQAAIEQKGLKFALEAVAKEAGGDVGKLQQLLGSVEAVAAVNVLAGTGAGKFSDELERQKNSAGAAQTAYEEMEKSTSRQFERLKVNFQNASIVVGNALLPSLNSVVGVVTELFGAFTTLPEPMQRTVVMFGGIAAATGPALIGMSKVLDAGRNVGGAFKALEIAPKLGRGISLLAGAFKTVGLALLTPPLGVVLAIGAVVTAIVLLYQKNESFRRFVTRAWAAIKGAVGAVGRFFTDTLFPALGAAVGAVGDAWGATTSFLADVWRGVMDAVSAAWNGVGKPIFEAIKTAIGVLLIPWKIEFAIAKAIFVELWEAVRATWSAIGPPIFGAIKTAVGALVAWWQFQFNVAKTVFFAAVTAVKAVWDTVLRPVFSAIASVLSTVVVAGFNAARAAIGAAFSAIGTAVSAVWNGVLRPLFSGIASFVTGPLAGAFRTFGGIVSGVWSGITSGASAAWNGAKDIIGGALKAIGKIVGAFAGAVATIADKVGLDHIAAGLRSFADSARTFGLAAGGLVPVSTARGRRRKTGGGFTTNVPTAIVGEGGPHDEYVIPTDPKYRKRALKLYGQLGERLVKGYVGGGVIDFFEDELIGPVLGGLQDVARFAGDLASKSVGEVIETIRKGGAALLGSIIPKAPVGDNLASFAPAGYNKFRGRLIDVIRGGAASAGAARDGALSGSSSGLNPEFLRRFNRYNDSLGGKFRIVSGFRTRAQQQKLYDLYQSGQGNLAARPGTSQHERGLAIDHAPSSTSGDRGVASGFRLRYPVRGEPWHVEPFAAGGVVRAAEMVLRQLSSSEGARERGVVKAESGGAAVVIHVDKLVVRDDRDVVLVSRELNKLIEDRQRARGNRPQAGLTS